MADGGNVTGGIETAASLAVFGLDPIRFLHLKDPLERDLMIELGKRIQKLQEIKDHNLAVKIAEQVGKLFK